MVCQWKSCYYALSERQTSTMSSVCLSLTTNENTRSAGEVLQWVKDKQQGAVKAVMADGGGAQCLSNTINAVFGE